MPIWPNLKPLYISGTKNSWEKGKIFLKSNLKVKSVNTVSAREGVVITRPHQNISCFWFLTWMTKLALLGVCFSAIHHVFFIRLTDELLCLWHSFVWSCDPFKGLCPSIPEFFIKSNVPSKGLFLDHCVV